MKQIIHIFGGGTITHVRPHLSLCAPAYGKTAKWIYDYFNKSSSDYIPKLHLTKMADSNSKLETNEDVSKKLEQIVSEANCKIIFLNTAFCDFEGQVVDENYEEPTLSGKDQPRLKTSKGIHMLQLKPSEKIVGNIRKYRKDIFLVAFKTTAGATPDEQFEAGLTLLKKNSCNLVLANDVHNRRNMIITPEMARYSETTDREKALKELVKMTIHRANGSFTRTDVKIGGKIPWRSPQIPETLRTVVNYCVARGAYKPFNGVTVGHFAVKLDEENFIMSKRKQNFNNLDEVGMVACELNNENIIAHGAKPSAGSRSQIQVFQDHPEKDCIIHFHVPLKKDSKVPVKPQWLYECGSAECGINTSKGLEEFDGIKAVMLEKHGPNIVFNKNIDPKKVIDFIENNFELDKQTSDLPG